jgi:hypothetical protein
MRQTCPMDYSALGDAIRKIAAMNESNRTPLCQAILKTAIHLYA